MHHGVLKQNTGAFQKYFQLFHNSISKNKMFKSKKVNLKAGSDSKESVCRTNLSWEDPLEKDMATHSSILAC